MGRSMQYITRSLHTEDGIVHELIFSPKKRRFLIPTKKDKINHTLIYDLPPGRYIKFALSIYSFLSSVIIQIKEVNVENANVVKETILLEYVMYSWELWDILSDPKAPKLLKKFLKMIPGRDKVAYIDTSFRVSDISNCIEDIDRYLEEYLEERRRRQWESIDKVL
jgi:hypothetical protein